MYFYTCSSIRLFHCGCTCKKPKPSWPEDVAPRPDDWSARWNRHSLSLPLFVVWDVACIRPEARGSWVVQCVLPFLCLEMFPSCFLSFFPSPAFHKMECSIRCIWRFCLAPIVSACVRSGVPQTPKFRIRFHCGIWILLVGSILKI